MSGLADYNDGRLAHAAEPVGLLDYVTSAAFAVDVAENWKSEYLQFFLYVFASVWVLLRGSPESKRAGWETDEDQ
ncbi:DUF6766 family protein [Amycolatopsis thailandensis]|uniref:DUF6766 family protein n=1 Tax=Amycolatopsis thailandensis TaxID=589330 RepID=UPI0037BB29A8